MLYITLGAPVIVFYYLVSRCLSFKTEMMKWSSNRIFKDQSN